MKILATILLLSLLIACESKPRGPVPLDANDACASCRMAISERRYAAELLDHEGNIYKFDDIACMLRFAHSHGLQISNTTFYVTDYANSKDWLDARNAYFTQLQSSVSSPMASGVVAFRNIGDAVRATGGKINHPLRFENLWSQNVDQLSITTAEKQH